MASPWPVCRDAPPRSPAAWSEWQAEEADRTYLHRGIAARHFQRTFVLAEGIEVLGASLEDGLLAIELAKPLAERVARRIEIDGRG